ncbi:uncharacterized protein LY79DRAFT_547440 [Colletotrichum navitas]|uniref:Uncharacterized protein n=1 Tax=Colletotrichum navitas TaxID=681940 RepID=A0AAD8V6Z2_9PEZI|nr:uncharacterized protein LY79DRAFT_547440 [Colletotrichum navitas]KAK1595339.1 hypothetical protein LY79DRAFT_547440 [Colletotrichum navitas]
MEQECFKPSLQCPMPGCKSAPFASAPNLARHQTAKHGAPVTMLCGKKLQNVPYNYKRHLFDSCGICMDILRMLGGRDLRADFKATSLDTLHHMHREMLHQDYLPGAQKPRPTWTGVRLKDEHEDYKTVSDSTTSASQAPDDSSSSEMFANRPCICPELNSSPKSEDIKGFKHQSFVELNHSTLGYAIGGNVSTDWQQHVEMPTHFDDAFEVYPQGQTYSGQMEVDYNWGVMSLG